MTYPIPYLDHILLSCAILFPAGIGGLLALPFQWKAKQSIFYSLVGMVGAYVIVTVLTLLVKREGIVTFYSAPLYFYLLAPLVGVFVIFCEYYIGVFQLFFATGKRIRGFHVHSYSNYAQIRIIDILMILAFVVGEELILRQSFALMFLNDFHLDVSVTIILCAIIYALNHITFGLQVVVQKVASGLIYTTLYYVSGLAILIPIIAHATQNLTLLALSRKGGGNG